MTRLIQGIRQGRFEFPILSLMLLVLHVDIWGDLSGLQSYALLVAHFGFFLLWQPLWEKGHSVQLLQVAAAVALFLIAYTWLQWWLLGLWVVLLIGLVSSRILYAGAPRPYYLLAVLTLVTELLIGIVPAVVRPIILPGTVGGTFAYLLLVPILLIMAGSPDPRAQTGRVQVDLLHGLLASALVSLVALGSIVITNLTDADYVDGLIAAVFTTALSLLAISWLWNPRVGFTGLGVLLNRYMLTIGGPFEQWLTQLSELTDRPGLSPEAFLRRATELMLQHEWLNGIEWSGDYLDITLGEQRGPSILFRQGSLLARVFFRSQPGTALQLHTRLLLRMVAQFYNAKQREFEQRTQAQLQVIHSTGARLTHDIKNLVQSLQGLLSAARNIPAEREGELKELLVRQLPLINERLNRTLEKLRAPGSAEIRVGSLQDWWRELKHRFEGRGLRFADSGGEAMGIPLELFDSVAENLIENAIHKRQYQPGIEIEVALESGHEGVTLRVCDSGSIIPEGEAERLFSEPSESGQGLGVGLYQSADLARRLNYRLRLVENRQGRVCFELTSRRSATQLPTAAISATARGD
jgi:signal transduction histidine kinase